MGFDLEEYRKDQSDPTNNISFVNFEKYDEKQFANIKETILENDDRDVLEKALTKRFVCNCGFFAFIFDIYLYEPSWYITRNRSHGEVVSECYNYPRENGANGHETLNPVLDSI